MKAFRFMIRRNFLQKRKNLIILFLIFWPSVQIIFTFINLLNDPQMYVIAPNQAAIIYDFNFGKIAENLFAGVYMYSIPIVIVMLNSEDCIDDQTSHLKNSIVTRIGLKKYVILHLLKSFFVGFILVFCGLMLNLLLVHIVYRGGLFTGLSRDFYDHDAYWTWMLNHQTLTNIIHITIYAFLAGLISLVGTITALQVRNKKIIYAVCVVMWAFLYINPYSIEVLIKSFRFIELKFQIIAFILTVTLCVLYVSIGLGRLIYNEKKNS